jgi:hypothetical protein
MDELTFILITRIFNFNLENPDIDFKAVGSYKDADYVVRLKTHQDGEALLRELLGHSYDEYIHRIETSLVPLDELYYNSPSLVVVVKQPSFNREAAFNSIESHKINKSALTALRLHSSRGVLYYGSYQFRLPLHPQGMSVIKTSPITQQFSFSPLALEPSVLSESDYDKCRATLCSLMNKDWDEKIAFDKVLWMSLTYYEASFTFQHVAHSFLILMLVVEVLFKRMTEQSLSQALSRISKLLAKNRNERKRIHKDFNDGPTSFRGIRNSIAHGDTTVDQRVIASRYLKLYEYLTRTIIELISIPDGELDFTKDYYDEISRYIEARYNALPAV